MISIEELKKLARLKGISSMGNAEKDYLIDLVLLSVSRNTKDELVFKGGTCLSKFYKLDRFSEDIDFTLRKELDINALLMRILADLQSFGIYAEIKESKTVLSSVMAIIRTKGPLYNGSPRSFSNIGIDINLQSGISMEPELAKYASIYPEVPRFSILIMHKEEILAEKVRAILSREKARDIYDLWFLLNEGARFDLNLVNEKLKYYGETWSAKAFTNKLILKESIWKTELAPLIDVVPDFREAKKFILENIPG